MSITKHCRACGEVFRKRSLKSTESICPDCRGDKGKNRYKVMTNKTVNAIATVESMEKEIEDMKTSIGILHDTMVIEIESQIMKGMDSIVERIVNEKVNSLKDIIISSMTKAQKTKDEVAELKKEIRSMRTGNTRLKNDMKEFREQQQQLFDAILVRIAQERLKK